MLSPADLERLIAVKRREIEMEKTRLGLSPPRLNENGDNASTAANNDRKVSFTEDRVPYDHNVVPGGKETKDLGEEEIPPDLERYIRRYIGLPVMLKAGEYSPNNPLVRAERASGDALLGLGEYERRKNTFRKLRQQQYREYLDQQAKKKQEEKEQAERERREREQREREQEERERERLERERASPERPRAHTNTVFSNAVGSQSFVNKVDTAVQTNGSRPLSVAVQTDDAELYRMSPSPSNWQLNQAERELSPRTVLDLTDRPIHRRSYGDFEAESLLNNRCKVSSEPRHYKPSIFDADAIEMRNVQAEKEAAAKRQYYQQELKNQIQEQQRIREERKAREKMLEQAEMRRLEEQLRMLRVAQEREIDKHTDIHNAMKENATDYEKKRTALQKEIDIEQQTLFRTQPRNNRPAMTSQSDTSLSTKLPFYYPTTTKKDKPYSTNIPDNSIFSQNYDVDSYLRRNLNPKKEFSRLNSVNSELSLSSKYLDYNKDFSDGNKVVALIHERPKEKNDTLPVSKPKNIHTLPVSKERNEDTLPIPVLRHSPINKSVNNSELSDAMRVVDDKWKVPIVQKNILKSLPNDEGKNVSILTQLGSIRRQLQLEQLRLDKMLPRDHI